jgi:ketosteroid isomerase-like protein
MSLSNAEKFRRALEAVTNGDIDAALRYVHPEVEWRVPSVLPDAAVYRGHDGVREWEAIMRDAFEELRLEPEGDFRELDEVHVLVPVRASGRGRESGIPVHVSFWMLGTGRELLERMEFFPSENDGLHAAGHHEMSS